MQQSTIIPALALVATISLVPVAEAAHSEVIVCNRGDGTFTVIDARSETVTGTYALPPGDATPEPMYVVYVQPVDLLFIGDRANDRVVAFRPDDYSTAVATIPAGNGVFHMWADPFGRQLWVNNDIDNTTTVIDPRSLSVIGTALTPDDLVAQGGKPHDVVLDWRARSAYVSVIGVPGDDWIVQYDTETLLEVNRVQASGDDVHLSYNFWRQELYAPTQGAHEVTTFDARSLAPRDSIDVPNAHGADMVGLGLRFFLTTNIAGGGADGVQLIDTRRNVVVDTVDTPFAVPHNLVVVGAPRGPTVYLTHSGSTSDDVSVYRFRGRRLELLATLDAGINPFGLTHIPAFP